MLQFRTNHGRGLWQVLKMVRALRSVQLISYVDERGQEHTYGLQISLYQPFAEIADPLIEALFDLLDSLDPHGFIPAEKLSMSYRPYVRIVLFVASYGPMDENHRRLSFEELCREVIPSR